MPRHPDRPDDEGMPQPHRYEIEIRGRATDGVLRPVIDEFRIEPDDIGVTRLTGEVRDPAHLNGILTHFTAMNIEVIALRRLDDTAISDHPSPYPKGN